MSSSSPLSGVSSPLSGVSSPLSTGKSPVSSPLNAADPLPQLWRRRPRRHCRLELLADVLGGGAHVVPVAASGDDEAIVGYGEGRRELLVVVCVYEAAGMTAAPQR